MLPEGPDKQIDIAREHVLRSEKLLVVYGELFSQPGNAVTLLVFAAWAAHSLFSWAALWLPAVCESRLVRPTI